MKNKYYFYQIEKTIQKFWKIKNSFITSKNLNKKKFYCLVMLPYPSGSLHIGHIRNYTIGDIIARYQRLNNKNVLHPIGWDAFGLPAENAAILHNITPQKWTKKNIKSMKYQLLNLGISYDWSKEINTCDSKYYKWDQWLFLQLFNNKLIYKKKDIVNWCPNDKTVLANEQVIHNKCWRCNTSIIYKYISQWFIKIKKYAYILYKNLKLLKKWPTNVINMQKNWIGKSKGYKIIFHIHETKKNINIFTNKLSNFNNIVCISISLTHKFIQQIYNQQIYKIQKNILCQNNNIYTGYKIPFNVIHPIHRYLIPIWITNFTECLFNTNVIYITNNTTNVKFYNFLKNNKLLTSINNHKKYKKYNSNEIKKKLLLRKKIQCHINYKLKEWSISRQRYWGTPIPIAYDNKHIIPIPYKCLPIILKKYKEYIKNTNYYISINKKKMILDHNTMDTFMESSWYYTRYITPNNNKNIFNIKKVNYWLPIDIYIGGIEHATLHLIYMRFMHQIMYKLKLVNTKEPIKRLVCQGLILNYTYYYINNNKKIWINYKYVKNKKYFYKNKKKIQLINNGIQKMSKSKNNGVNPNYIINQYGADTLRIFIIFIAPIKQNFIWNENGIIGCYNLLKRIWNIGYIFLTINKKKFIKYNNVNKHFIYYHLYNTIYNITNDIKTYNTFNTAISTLMIFIKNIYKITIKSLHDYAIIKKCINCILILLLPFAPHISTYLWIKINKNYKINKIKWPKINHIYLKKQNNKLIIQINGKKKHIIITKNKITKYKLITLINKKKILDKYLYQKKIIKIIFIPQKLINFIIN